ncbi:MAG: ATP-binding cassette domain-containing protein [Acidobacteriota bacterium]|nr:ATP-binding cassette domain-containing protein [Acidobacteriota bacterium]
MSPILTTRGLIVGYGGIRVAGVPDLAIAAGDRIIIRGANGSGKTTALKTLARLLTPISGEMSGAGAGPGGAIYVHPAPYLFAGTGVSNVLLGAHGRREQAAHAIDALGAALFAQADVRTLSNGQRQRIALARALATHPRLLLVDEADTGLDADGLALWHEALASRAELAVVMASALQEDRTQNAEYSSYILNR